MPVTRRTFLERSTATAAGLAAASQASFTRAENDAPPGEFRSDWSRLHDRVWLGPAYWANPLQDWRVKDGRIECVKPALDRNVHLLVRQLAPQRTTFRMAVRVGRVDGRWGQGRGSAGFRVGIQGPLKEYRNSLFNGSGLDAGLTGDGRLFIGSPNSGKEIPVGEVDAVELRLNSDPDGDGFVLVLAAHDVESGKKLGEVVQQNVNRNRLTGNVALVANFGRRRRGGKRPDHPGTGRFWFDDWRLSGRAFQVHDEHAFGPVLFSQYTLSGGVLKLTAQMPPLGEQDSQEVELHLKNRDAPQVATIHPDARTATFRVEGWDAGEDVPYTVVYRTRFKDGTSREDGWSGTIRRDPVEKDVLTVADVSCNIHAAFPNHGYVGHMAKLDPDLIAFVGDQFYESTAGYGVVRNPVEPAMLDYLRKWYVHGWTWRELTRDRPSVSIPDDHDVYQGNIWGEGGAGRQRTQEAGGYGMDPRWVNVVHRTQTSHHPDPYDPTPIKQDISVYYGPLTYGRVSFAVIADRMFKTGPDGVAPPTKGRADHVKDPNFNPATADVPEADLLGERQLEFLRDWIDDWQGADMKAVVSQTIFTAMATTHGSNRMRLRADYDTNGWPQSKRNEALRILRKCFPVHLAGDQHLPAVVQYGVDEHRDAFVAFAGPAVNVGYPRWWEPEEPGQNREPGAPQITGDFTDHFGHPLTVLAVQNGAANPPRGNVLELMQAKASGLGVVRFDKQKRTVTFECWPYLADPKTDDQFPGWPVTVEQFDNGPKPKAWLPTLKVQSPRPPVVQVVDPQGETVYAVRAPQTTFQPFVYAEGTYTVLVSEPDSGGAKRLDGLKARKENDEVIEVRL